MNKTISTKIGLIIVLALSTLAGLFILFESKQEKTNINPMMKDRSEKLADSIKEEESLNNLFYVTLENNKITAYIFDSKNNNIIKSKIIKIDDNLSSSSVNAIGTNDSVQYNSKTKDIFISTNGASEYDGTCINKDKTCYNRIYKTNLDSNKKPDILFQTKDYIENWIVNPDEESVIVGVNSSLNYGNEKLSLKSIDINNKIIKSITENASTGGGMVLSKNKKYIFQILNGDNLILSKINIATGSVENINIFQEDIGLSEAFVSPDGRYVAFHYKGGIKIYDVLNNKIIDKKYSGEVGNFGIEWSQDGEKITYILKDRLVYFNVETGQEIIIGNQGNALHGYYVYRWNPSDKYIMYDLGLNNGIKFFDTFENKTVKFNQNIFSETGHFSVIAIDWF